MIEKSHFHEFGIGEQAEGQSGWNAQGKNNRPDYNNGFFPAPPALVDEECNHHFNERNAGRQGGDGQQGKKDNGNESPERHAGEHRRQDVEY